MFITGFPELLFTQWQPNNVASFNGFLLLQGIEQEVELRVPHFPHSRGAILYSPNFALSAKLHTAQQHLYQAAEECGTLTTFLKKVQQILSDDDHKDIAQDEGVPDWWLCLLRDLEGIGWHNISSVSTELRRVTVKAVVAEREHLLHVSIQPGYPYTKPSYEASLPVTLNPTNTTLCGSVDAWWQQLGELQQFWDVMAELDGTAAVLDPATPQLHHTHRRILLSNQVSVHLVVSPFSPHSPPQCQMIGSSHLTAPLLTLLTQRYHEWDSERSIVGNLEQLLQVTVVRRGSGRRTAPDHSDSDDSDDEMSDAGCVICFSLHYGTELPDSICEHCHQAMHLTCLYTWLSGLSHSRQSMQFICGDCPCCKKPISCKVPA
uniref:E3 ubiquitin-protein ligase FANCL-like n=1 Tax=Hirondellea gigas TaxID=1518452 RepID=A0A2P2I6H8_9CRUS